MLCPSAQLHLRPPPLLLERPWDVIDVFLDLVCALAFFRGVRSTKPLASPTSSILRTSAGPVSLGRAVRPASLFEPLIYRLRKCLGVQKCLIDLSAGHNFWVVQHRRKISAIGEKLRERRTGHKRRLDHVYPCPAQLVFQLCLHPAFHSCACFG